MALRFVLTGEPFHVQLERRFAFIYGNMRKAMKLAAKEVAANIEYNIKQDIQAAGNFSSRWQNSFKVTVRYFLFGADIDIRSNDPIFVFFTKGGIIHGKPLLWLPLSGSGVTVPPSRYPGKLFSGKSRKGTPLLFSAVSKKPIYFGVAVVHIPQKFHLDRIVRAETAKFGEIYRQRFRDLQK